MIARDYDDDDDETNIYQFFFLVPTKTATTFIQQMLLLYSTNIKIRKDTYDAYIYLLHFIYTSIYLYDY